MRQTTSTILVRRPSWSVVLGEYTLERILAREAPWDIYAGRWQHGALEPVRVYVLAPDTPAPRSSVDAIAADARQLMQLRHHGLAPVLATGIQAGTAVIVVAELAGRTLRERLARAPEGLDPIEVARIVLDVGATLDYLHAQVPPILHGRLHAGCVLLAEPGMQVKLLDVACGDWSRAELPRPDAGSRDAEAEVTREWTPQGLCAEDQRALASLAFECLAGAARFAALGDRPKALNASEWPSLAAIGRPGAAAEVDRALHQAWDTDPCNCFPSAGTFAVELARVLMADAVPVLDADIEPDDGPEIQRMPGSPLERAAADADGKDQQLAPPANSGQDIATPQIPFGRLGSVGSGINPRLPNGVDPDGTPNHVRAPTGRQSGPPRSKGSDDTERQLAPLLPPPHEDSMHGGGPARAGRTAAASCAMDASNASGQFLRPSRLASESPAPRLTRFRSAAPRGPRVLTARLLAAVTDRPQSPESGPPSGREPVVLAAWILSGAVVLSSVIVTASRFVRSTTTINIASAPPGVSARPPPAPNEPPAPSRARPGASVPPGVPVAAQPLLPPPYPVANARAAPPTPTAAQVRPPALPPPPVLVAPNVAPPPAPIPSAVTRAPALVRAPVAAPVCAGPPSIQRPSAEMRAAARLQIATHVHACVPTGGGHGRHARFEVTYAGATGRPSEVHFLARQEYSRGVVACVETAAHEVSLPCFRAPERVVRYSVRLP